MLPFVCGSRALCCFPTDVIYYSASGLLSFLCYANKRALFMELFIADNLFREYIPVAMMALKEGR